MTTGLSLRLGAKVHDFRRPHLVGLVTRLNADRVFFRVSGKTWSCTRDRIRLGGATRTRPRKPRKSYYTPSVPKLFRA